jgi:lipopolysaccharide export LptBFGC system permease protein LptF
LAFSLGIKKGRGGGGHGTAKALIILISFYILYFFLISLAQKGNMDPMLANFAPSALFALIGLHYYRKLDWAG